MQWVQHHAGAGGLGGKKQRWIEVGWGGMGINLGGWRAMLAGLPLATSSTLTSPFCCTENLTPMSGAGMGEGDGRRETG